MTGKLVEMGDIECLEGLPDDQRSGVVIQIDREQLKASRNLFGEIVSVDEVRPGIRRESILLLRTEVDCRIKHGAESNGHLEFVQKKLDEILKESA